MGFWSDLGRGISSHISAIEFIAKHRLWHYFIFPLLITIGLWTLGFWSISSIGSGWGEKLLVLIRNYFGYDDSSSAWFDKIAGVIIWAGSFILRIILWIVFMKALRYIVLIICSPVMALLSARVDELQNGYKTKFEFGQFLYDLLRSLLVVIRNFFMEMLVSLLIVCIGWIPVIGWISLLLLFFTGWFYLGFNMMDYTYERRRMSISQGAQFTRRHRGLAIGNGFMYTVLLWIPLVGICLAPILSSVAATIATTENLPKK